MACKALGRPPAGTGEPLADTIALPVDVDPRFGFAVTPSAIVVFDASAGRVVGLDRSGAVRWTYGRQGDGPGEFARPFSTRFHSAPGAKWVAADQGRVVVFDGRTFFILSEQGELAQSWSADALARARSGSSRRVRMRGARVYVDILGSMETRARGTAESVARRRDDVYAVDSATALPIAALEMPPLPVNEAGTIVDGLAQAKPSWDLWKNCLVLTDGHSSRVVFLDVASGRSDTVDVGLPEWYIDVATANQEMRGITPVGIPEPTARARVTDLTLAADGMLWFRPAAQSARNDAGQVVWLYNVHTGTLTQDTVAVFPRYADQAGGVYGITADSNGTSMLLRVRVPRRP